MMEIYTGYMIKFAMEKEIISLILILKSDFHLLLRTFYVYSRILFDCM